MTERADLNDRTGVAMTDDAGGQPSVNRRGEAAPASTVAPRLVLFAMRCAFSVPPLAALLAAGLDVRALVLPAAPGAPPLARPRPDPAAPDEIERLAAAAGLPILAVPGLRSPEVAAALADLSPDLLVVACFPWKVPVALRRLAPHGGLNLHPSLLPLGRGPEPVFWTLRRGERQTGVTIHRLTNRFDAGPIVAQEAIPVPDGIRAPDLERRLAEVGARLLVPTIRAVVAGTAPERPQPETPASAAPVPAPADWLVPTNLPAGWAYNFVRGVAPLGGPPVLLVLTTGERIAVADALAWDPTATLPAPYVESDDAATLTVRFRPGTVTVARAPVARAGG